MINFTKFIKFTCITASLLLLSYILINNYVPFGVTKAYTTGLSKDITDLGPKGRVEKISSNSATIYKQTSDLIYFNTTMPFQFDQATVKISYKNSNPDQQLFLGFQDQTNWHYTSKLIDNPLFRDLKWQRIGNSPYLYQRNPDYTSIDQYFTNPPKNKKLGTLNYDIGVIDLSKIKLVNYKKSNQYTIIDTPLRGKTILYTYLEDEPFSMDFDVVDLNQYPEPDNFDIYVYKGPDLVYQVTTSDDGINDGSGKISSVRNIHIQNPGPDLPENGIYKVVIDAPADIVIKKIKTNLNKIVFQGPINPVNNAQVFQGVTDETKPTTLFTNAISITAKTYHGSALQDIKVASSSADLSVQVATSSTISKPKINKLKMKNSPPQNLPYKIMRLTTINQDMAIDLEQPISQIQLPKSDVIVNGKFGYFAFSQDQLFMPTSNYLLPLTEPNDIDKVDYILTDYMPPKLDGNWLVTEANFDLTPASIQKGKLSWLIKAPGLKENNRQIFIKNIEVIFTKKPLININKLPWK